MAIIGASEKKGSIGSALVENLVNAGYAGDIYPVNPKHKKIHGYKALKSVSDTEKSIDLAIIAVPIQLVPDIITDCVAGGVKGAVIISAGGRETGEKGREIEEKIKKCPKRRAPDYRPQLHGNYFSPQQVKCKLRSGHAARRISGLYIQKRGHLQFDAGPVF